MKKRILGVIISAVLVAMTGCQQKDTPVAVTNQVVDSIFYLQDSDAAYDNLGMDSKEMRDIFLGLSEEVLQGQFYPTEEEAVEEGAEEEATDEETAEEEVAEEPIEIDPVVKEMAQKLMDSMQGVVKYKTKIMLQNNTSSLVKLTLYGMDVSAYYTNYITLLSSIPEMPENPTEEEKAAVDQQLKELYMQTLDDVKTSTTPVELSVELYKSDGKWYISDLNTLISNLFYIYTGISVE